jgi:signal transduction histidine kinase
MDLVSNNVADDPINILLVDDEPAKLHGYQSALEELGENLLTAHSTRGALELLQENDVALLLVDVVMPEHDGFELVEMLRAHPRFNQTAVIFVSNADSSDLDRIREYSAGAVDYVPAPVVPELLRAKVRVFADLYRKTRQLEALNRDLEAEGQRKDEFLATLGHELRNPLAPMLNCVRMLKSGALTPAAVARQHNIVERQVLHLVRLVDDLLDVTRMTRGTIALEREPTDLGALVRAAIDATRLSGTGHLFITEIPERGPFVSVDPARMTQVVSSILDNATKFTPAGGKIEVGVAQVGNEAVLRVADSGIGIAPDDLDHVFDLFSQLDHGGRGLGIGLALVRRLLELQDGSITASSKGAGQGAEFVVRLPCQSEVVAEFSPADSTTTVYQPVRFLIVDDNVSAADTLAEFLELSGYRARATYSGAEALRVGENFEPDMVLLDLGMPFMDGFETAQRLRQTGWGRRAKIVAVTGWGQTSERQRTAEAGFDGHLLKPVDFDEVVELVELVVA